MRIAIFSDNFYPELSGISDSVISLAKNLAARGHVINFYVPRYAPEDYAAANVPTREIDLGPNISITRFASFAYHSTGTGHARLVIPFGLRALIVAQFHPDIIHTQQFFGVGLEGLFAARILSIPFVGTNHTATKEFLRYSPIRSAWLDGLLLGYVNWYYERCAVVTAPSKSVFDEMAASGFNTARAHVMPNPVNTQIFRPIADTERAVAKKKFGFNDTTIIHAGRLSDERKPAIVLEALAEIKKTIPSAMLAFAERERLRKNYARRQKRSTSKTRYGSWDSSISPR